MNEKNIQQWINVLPMDKWTTLHDGDEKPIVTFKLAHYEVVNGAPKFSILVKNGLTVEGGISETKICDQLTIRIYIPMELHPVPGVGLSPKFVYRLPRGCRIEEYKAPPKEEVLDRFVDRARRHNIIRT